MNFLKEHEKFEIEVLEKLKNNKFLEPLVFGGGTMLRLCYDLNRYSNDLDFWFIKNIKVNEYFNKFKKYLAAMYELTDAKIKFYTILFEIRSKNYPKRLKIEIRKVKRNRDFQDRIAFSKYSPKQVMLRVFTMEEIMKMKIEALIDRKEIRDAFDIEFLLRQGIEIKSFYEYIGKIKGIIGSFRDNDYKIKLGAILDPNDRKYYIKNRFDFLIAKLTYLENKDT